MSGTGRAQVLPASQPAKTFGELLFFLWLPLGDDYVFWKANGRLHMSRRDFQASLVVLLLRIWRLLLLLLSIRGGARNVPARYLCFGVCWLRNGPILRVKLYFLELFLFVFLWQISSRGSGEVGSYRGVVW